jgi:hypothetical protein
MNIGDLIGRVFPSMRGKARIDYNFDILDPPNDDKYQIVLNNDLKKTWFLQLIKAFNSMTPGANIQLLNQFEVTHPKLKEQMLAHLKPTLEKVVKDIRKDAPMKNLKLMSANIDNMRFIDVDAETVKSIITISGVCSYGG